MVTGMMWFDNDPKADLVNKIARAAEYYQKKYGLNPDLCFVHPSMVADSSAPAPLKAGRIEVRANRSILPNHFWIGVHAAG